MSSQNVLLTMHGAIEFMQVTVLWLFTDDIAYHHLGNMLLLMGYVYSKQEECPELDDHYTAEPTGDTQYVPL